MQPVKTSYRAHGISVQYHFLAVVVDDAMEKGTFNTVVELIDSEGDEFGRGCGSMAEVGFGVGFRADAGPIDIELDFGPVPEPTEDKSWTAVVSFARDQLDAIVFADSAFGELVALPNGPGSYRVQVQWRYRERPEVADIDAPWETWSEEDQNNPGDEDFWETIVIHMESAPDAEITAVPYQDRPPEPEYDPDENASADWMPRESWTDAQGEVHPWTDAQGTEEWMRQHGAIQSPTDQPTIMVMPGPDGKELTVLFTGVPHEMPMVLPADSQQVADYIAPSMFAEVGRRGRYVYGRRSSLPPDDARWLPE